MKKLLVAITLLLFSQHLIGQVKSVKYKERNLITDRINMFPDSIRVDLPNENSFVIFELQNYKSDYSIINNLNSSLAELMTFIKQSSTDPDFATTPHQATIREKNDGSKEIIVQTTEANSTKITTREKQLVELLPAGWEIKIYTGNDKAYIYGKDLNSIERIAALDFKVVSDKINEQIPESIGRKAIKAYTLLIGGKIERSKIDLKKSSDLIVSEPSIGFGFISDSFYPLFKPISFTIVHRDRFGRKNLRIKLDQGYMFLTRKRLDGKTTLNLVDDTSLSLGWNLEKNNSSIRWFDLGIGVLNSNNDQTYFRGNTLRFFLSYDAGNNFSLTPEFYLTDNVTNALGGLRLNYKFP